MNSRPGTVYDDVFVERLARLLDRWVKIGPFSVGLDGLLGLIPGVGDVTSGAFSALIIFKAFQQGVPKSAILRMVLNVGIDSLVGSIPLIGDLFDFAFKANLKNLEIYQSSLGGNRPQHKDWAFIAVVAAILLFLILLPLLWITFFTALISWEFRGGQPPTPPAS
jgi:hypothetical protein